MNFDLYKTKLCKNYLSGSCWYGDECHFAHGYSEIMTKDNYNLPLNYQNCLYSDSSSEGAYNNIFIPRTREGRKRLHFIKKNKERISKKSISSYLVKRANRHLFNSLKYGEENYQIMRETGLGAEDLALQMMGWDKEDRDYAFIDRYWDQ